MMRTLRVRRWGLMALSLFLVLTTASAQPRAAASADLQYLQHSGWVVRTPTHILVFDYVETLPSQPPLPDSLRLTPASFDQRRVVVFVSHSHEDHFDRVVETWRKEHPDIQYVVGAGVVLPGARTMAPRETWTSGGLTVRTTGSTDEGVGFDVAVDGMRFYHAGDHARWVDALDQAFMSEIHWLGSAGAAIDIAFFPIATGTACEPRPAIAHGVHAAAQSLHPKILFPMHVGCVDRLGLYDRFRTESRGVVGRTQVIAPAARGARFRYASGRMEQVGR